MQIHLSYKERIAGLFLLIAVSLIVLFVLGAAVENMWFTPKVHYRVHLVRGEGLRIGSEVLIAGVEAGRVDDMRILPDGRIEVALSIVRRFAPRVVAGTRAEVRRALGLGEKRILLRLPVNAPRRTPLPANAVLPADEPKDLVDVVSSLDLGHYVETLDRVVQSVDVLMSKMEEEDRLVRMVEAFEQLGPTMEIMNGFFSRIEEPFLTLISDPNIPRAFKGGAKVFNDPKTRKLIAALEASVDPQRIDALLTQTERLLTNLDRLTREGGHLDGTLAQSDALLRSGKIDRVLTTMDAAADPKKIERLLRNLDKLTVEMAKIGPQLPAITKETTRTMRELLIVLKALQKSWLLDDETEDVLRELGRERRSPR